MPYQDFVRWPCPALGERREGVCGPRGWNQVTRSYISVDEGAMGCDETPCAQDKGRGPPEAQASVSPCCLLHAPAHAPGACRAVLLPAGAREPEPGEPPHPLLSPHPLPHSPYHQPEIGL